MRRFGTFLAGILTTFAIVAIAAAVFFARAHGFSAREKPSGLEAWVATQARAMAAPENTAAAVNPVPDSPEVQAEARAHWADHCATCHANNGSGDTEMGKHMYPPAPDMRQAATQNLSDGELFYIIENGVRLTGMPAWGGSSHSSEDSWKLVRFIRHLPQLTQEEQIQMEQLNPKTPDELKEEQEERDFLNGADTDADTQKHNH